MGYIIGGVYSGGHINGILLYLKCSKNHKKHFNKDLIKRFANTYEFFDGDINKFCLMLKKSVYPYEYMDSCKSFDETSLPDKKDIYSNLNMEDTTDQTLSGDFQHAYDKVHV